MCHFPRKPCFTPSAKCKAAARRAEVGLSGSQPYEALSLVVVNKLAWLCWHTAKRLGSASGLPS
jgi:hypothetical protein